MLDDNKLYKRKLSEVKFLIIHCTDTRLSADYTVGQLESDHRRRGFCTVGYHYYIRKDGTLTQHRLLDEIGAHCRPYNRRSVGICYEGGRGDDGLRADTRTPEQKQALLALLKKLLAIFPKAEIRGHRDMPGVRKLCPCFDAREEYGDLIVS